MEQTSKTETEQLYEKMTDKAEEQTQEPEETEQAEEQAEQDIQDEEELLTEEELEIEREIESYKRKIEKLDGQLGRFRAEKTDKLRVKAMEKAGYTSGQIEKYAKYLEGKTEQEIDKSLVDLAQRIHPLIQHADPSPMNRLASPPRVDVESKLQEAGRNAYERVKHKIFPWLRG